MKNCPIVFCCDGKARATLIASWYRQMGFERSTRSTAAPRRGSPAGARSRQARCGRRVPPATTGARAAVRAARRRASCTSDAAGGRIFVDTSQDFARGPRARRSLGAPGWLELWIGDVVPAEGHGGRGHAASTGAAPCWPPRRLKTLGYQNVSVARWRHGGLAARRACRSRRASRRGHGRADRRAPRRPRPQLSPSMQNYLRWEEALGSK